MPEARALKDEILNTDQPQQQFSVPGNSLMLQLTQEQMDEVVDIVRQDYQSADDARNQKTWGGNEGEELTWDEKYAQLIKLYENQNVARPEKWMSNASLRIAMAIVEMMFAKLYPAVWNEESVRWKPVEFTDQDRAERISKFMKYITDVPMRFRRIVKTGVKYCIKYGTVIFKDSWVDKYEDKGEVDQIPITDEMGQPVVDPQTGQPQMATQPKISVNSKAEVEVVPIDRLYIQPGQTDLQKEPIIHRLSYYYSDLELMELEGKIINIENTVKNKVDAIIGTEIDKTLEEAEKIAKMNVKRRVYPMDILQWYGPYDANNDRFPEECVFLVDMTTWTYLGGVKLSDISRRNRRPFVKTGFLERENSFYWIGVLEQVKPLAEELDTAIRQLLDANTISIMRFGFYDPSGNYDPETHTIKPRAMYPVRNPQQNVYFPDLSIPIERLVIAIRTILEFVERLTAASSYAMGKESEIVGGSGTATRTQAIMTSSNERYAVPSENLRDGIAEVLTNILCQYQKNIQPGYENRVLGEKGEQIFKPGELSQESLDGELDAYLLPSASMGDKNVELSIANWVYQNLLMNPLIATSMERVYKVTERPLKAMGIEPEELLGKKPYSKHSDIPDDEHTMIREGVEVHPEPQENHIFHLMQHTAFMQDPSLSQWPQEAVAALQAHIQETQLMFQQLITMMQKGGKGGDIGGNQGIKTTGAEPGKGGLAESGTNSALENVKRGTSGSPTPIG